MRRRLRGGAIKRFLLRLDERDFQLKYKPEQFLYGIIKNTWKENLRYKKKEPGGRFPS